VLGGELTADGAPHPVLFVGVSDPRSGIAFSPGERDGGDLVATRAVGGIVRAGVIVRQMHGHRTALVGGHRGIQLSFFVHLLSDRLAPRRLYCKPAQQYRSD
jgi:hypothetical protein